MKAKFVIQPDFKWSLASEESSKFAFFGILFYTETSTISRAGLATIFNIAKSTT